MAAQDILTELWRLVTFYSTNTDISKLSRTCKSIYTSVLPLLYEIITVDFCKPGQSNKIPLLLRSLQTRPELGQHLRRLVIREHRWLQSVWTDQNTVDLLPTVVLEGLVERGREITQDQSESWLKELTIGNLEAFTILLLSYCPKIHHLQLDNDFQKTWAWNTVGIAPNYNTLWQLILSLQHLISIDIDRPGHKPVPWNTNRVVAVFKLPNIKSIKMSFLEDEIRFGEPLDDIKAPHLETLELWNSLVNEDTIQRLVSAAPKLSSLRLDLKRHTAITDGRVSYVDQWIDAFKLASALQQPTALTNTPEVKPLDLVANHALKSLQYLAISTCWRQTTNSWDVSNEGGLWGTEDWSCQHGIKGFIGSLKHLSNLKGLEISLEMLLGWDDETATPLHELLPDSLTHLCLTAEHGCWEYSIWTGQSLQWPITKLFLDYKEFRYLGNLKHVKVFLPSCVIRHSIEDNLPELEDAINQAGAEYEVVKLNRQYGTGWQEYSYNLDLFGCKYPRDLYPSGFTRSPRSLFLDDGLSQSAGYQVARRWHPPT